MLYMNDSSRVWHVAKTGSDSNSGHAGQYPVNLANDAKLTIGAAVSAAVDGDTIIIWPGDYAEVVNTSSKALRITGTHKDKTRIVPASGTPLTIGSNTYVANLSCIGTGTGLAAASAASNITIENCYVYAPTDGFYPSGTGSHIRLIRCHFKSDWDGVNMAGAINIYAEDCLFETTGINVNSCHAVQEIGSGVYRDCIFVANSSTTASGRLIAVEFAGNTTQRAIFANCCFFTSASAGRTGEVLGLRMNKSTSVAVLHGCLFNTIGPGASGGPMDLKNAAGGTIIVRGCHYLTSSGVIIQSGSGWSDSLATALFTNGPANKLNVDASGRVNVGAIKGVDADAMIKVIKLLKNKAAQDKLTGAIRYYDDDGQTVILTHTPSEDESSFTRTVS
jgi:hypothetical protein